MFRASSFNHLFHLFFCQPTNVCIGMMCGSTLVYTYVRPHLRLCARWLTAGLELSPRGGGAHRERTIRRAQLERSRAALNPLTMNYACWSIAHSQTTKKFLTLPERDGFYFTKWSRQEQRRRSIRQILRYAQGYFWYFFKKHKQARIRWPVFDSYFSAWQHLLRYLIINNTLFVRTLFLE